MTVYAQAHGISEVKSLEGLSVLNGGSIVGRVIIPLLADRIGRFNIFGPICLLCSVISLALWINATNVLSIMWFAALYGLLSGATVSLTSSCVAQISKPEEMGTRIGMFNSLLALP